MREEAEATEDNSMVLLGAGASADAGLPLAAALTQCALTAVSSVPDEGQNQRALNYVVAAMQLWDVRAGFALSDGIGIERLVSAVELLANRQRLEVSPFIHTWDGTVVEHEETPAYVDDYEIRRFIETLQTPSDSRYMHQDYRFTPQHQTVQRVFSQLTNKRRRESFKSLHAWLVNQVVADLDLDNSSRSDYFIPLVTALSQTPGAWLATLNYDLCLETAAERASLEYHRFVDEWSSTGVLVPAPANGLKLLKLHGSIDWVMTPDDDFRVGRPDDGSYRDWRPALVYGQREKLRVGGPFLQLFEQFRTRLMQSDRLIVVGYSFSDPHINTLVVRWLKTNPNASLLVCDPFFPEVSASVFSGYETEQVSLWRRFGPEPSVNPLLSPGGNAVEEQRPRLAVVRQSAKDIFAEIGAIGLSSVFEKYRPRSA